jgi:hypothetical protein
MPGSETAARERDGAGSRRRTHRHERRVFHRDDVPRISPKRATATTLKWRPIAHLLRSCNRPARCYVPRRTVSNKIDWRPARSWRVTGSHIWIFIPVIRQNLARVAWKHLRDPWISRGQTGELVEVRASSDGRRTIKRSRDRRGDRRIRKAPGTRAGLQ